MVIHWKPEKQISLSCRFHTVSVNYWSACSLDIAVKCLIHQGKEIRVALISNCTLHWWMETMCPDMLDVIYQSSLCKCFCGRRKIPATFPILQEASALTCHRIGLRNHSSQSVGFVTLMHYTQFYIELRKSCCAVELLLKSQLHVTCVYRKWKSDKFVSLIVCWLWAWPAQRYQQELQWETVIAIYIYSYIQLLKLTS